MRLLPVVLLVLVIPLTREAQAQTCALPALARPELALASADARLAFLAERLQEDARHARLWAWGWGVGLFGVTATQGAFLLLDGPGTRVDQINGMFTSTVGWAQIAIRPPKVLADAERLAERSAKRGDDPCELLALAENLLARDAKDEEKNTGIVAHAGNAAFNVSVALALGLGFDHWRSAAIQATLGTAVGAIKILMQPTGSIAALEEYRAGRLARKPAGKAQRRDGTAAASWGLAPLFPTQGAGLAFALAF